MPKSCKQTKYDFDDYEDREVVEEDFQEDYDNYSNDNNYDNNYNNYNNDKNYEEVEYFPEQKEVYTAPCSWESEPVEEPILKSFQPEVVKSFQEIEDEAYEQFMSLVKEDKIKYQRQLDELNEWCSYVGITIDEMPGSFEDKYEEMCFNKEIQSKKLEEARKIQEEKERLRRVAQGEANLKAISKANSLAGKKRAEKKSQQANSKGKLQGSEKTGLSKRARKANKDRLEKSTRTSKIVLMVEPKPVVVPQIELIPSCNVKSSVGAPAESIEVAPEIQEEEVEVTPIIIKEQIVIEEPKVVVKVVQQPFTAVPTRKSKSNITSEEVSKILFSYGNEETVRSSKTEVKTVRSETQTFFTKMCNSVFSHKPCVHGTRCRFAHSVDQLQIINCNFGDRCRHGKSCQFFHKDDTLVSYAIRLGYPLPKARPVAPPQPPKAPINPFPKFEHKSEYQKSGKIIVYVNAATKLAPWAKLTVIPVVVEAPKVEAPKVEAPKVEKVEAPKVEKVEAPKVDNVEKVEAPKVEAPKVDEVDAPKEDENVPVSSPTREELRLSYINIIQEIGPMFKNIEKPSSRRLNLKDNQVSGYYRTRVLQAISEEYLELKIRLDKKEIGRKFDNEGIRIGDKTWAQMNKKKQPKQEPKQDAKKEPKKAQKKSIKVVDEEGFVTKSKVTRV